MGLYFYSCKSFDFRGKGEKVMLKRGNAKRWKALSLAVALYVGGGQLFLNHVYAADVTGGDVLVDGTPAHPVPAVPIAGGAITNAADSGNVYGNKLTLDGTTTNFNGYIYGGYNFGTGDAFQNELILKNGASIGSNYHPGYAAYGGWTQNGNATNNTITLEGNSQLSYWGTHMYGGWSNNSSADVKTDNRLRLKAKDNYALSINNFEKLEFELDSAVVAGNTILTVSSQNTVQTFDWNKVKVTNAADWSGTTGLKPITLYTGPGLTLDNYDLSKWKNVTADGKFEYGWRSDVTTATPGTPTTITNAAKIYFDRNQFKGAKPVITTAPTDGIAYGGLSTLGNTTTENILTLDGASAGFVGYAYGGYTKAETGDSIGNELILKNGAYIGSNYSPGYAAYGGWTQNGNATNNTITLEGNSQLSYWGTHMYGGWSNNSSADVKTDNRLRLKAKDNYALSINNFEKLEFELGSAVASGNTILTVSSQNVVQTFDWNKVKVTHLREWATALAANNVNTPTVTLYTGPGLTLNNYAPTIIGTRGDYEFGKWANGSLSGTTMTGATRLIVDGNRFQNAGIGQNVTTPGTTTRATYSGLSIYGNTTNHNELNLTGGYHANARAGYTDAQSGGSDFNTLNLNTGGSLTNGYAGYTTGVHLLVNPEDENHPELVDTTKNADAKNNTVNINGGTLNAGGKLYGGYIATNTVLSATSAGDASGNTINIENGIFGGNTEIYGGYTNGTGKATGNTVNLGTTAGVLTSSTLQNVFIYGGAGASSSDVFTDNLLNVNAKGLTARNITNFGKTHFNLGGMGTIATTDQLLTLNGGATNGLDWAGVEVNPGSHTFMPGIYDARLFTAMHNAVGISFTKNGTGTYAPVGAKEFLKGDFEYIIDTASGTVSAQDVVVDGFRFRNHTGAAYTAADGTHAAGWAGRTASGQTVENNKLLVSGGILTDAYGGLVENRKHRTDGSFQTMGDAKKNILEITGGTVTNAYGAKVAAAAGNAE